MIFEDHVVKTKLSDEHLLVPQQELITPNAQVTVRRISDPPLFQEHTTPTPTGMPVTDPFSSSSCGRFGVAFLAALGLDPFPIVPPGGDSPVSFFAPVGSVAVDEKVGDPNFGHACFPDVPSFASFLIYLFNVPQETPGALNHDPSVNINYYDGCPGRFLAFHLSIHAEADFIRGDCAFMGSTHYDVYQNQDFTGYDEVNGTIINAGNGRPFPSTEPGILVTFSGNASSGTASVTPVPIGGLAPIRDFGPLSFGTNGQPGGYVSNPPPAPPFTQAWNNSVYQDYGSKITISGKLLMTLSCCPPTPPCITTKDWIGWLIAVQISDVSSVLPNATQTEVDSQVPNVANNG